LIISKFWYSVAKVGSYLDMLLTIVVEYRKYIAECIMFEWCGRVMAEQDNEGRDSEDLDDDEDNRDIEDEDF
jgi:hypothetical protein